MSFRSRTLLALAAGIATTTIASAADETSGAELLKRIQDLDQQVRILGRKAEITEEAAAEKAKTAVTAKADASGFSIGNSDKNNPYSAKLGLLVQADGRFWINDTAAQQSNTFLLRRAQPTIDVQLGKFLRARVQGSFNATTAGSPAFELLESWAEFKPSEKLAITGGRFKVLGQEYIQGSGNLAFPERGLPTNLTPSYEVGFNASGKLGETFQWLVGVGNGSPDLTTRTADNDDDKDGFLRVGWAPFKTGDSDLLKGLNLSFGTTYGYEANGLTAGYRSPGQVTVFAYDATAAASGTRTRYAPALEWAASGASLLAEYTVSQQDAQRGGQEQSLSHSAWQLVGTWLLSDDVKGPGGSVVPKRAFDPETGAWGAFEVVGRVGELRIDDATFEGTAAQRLANPTTQIAKAQSVGLGVNWYVSRNLKWQLAGDYTRFDGGGGGTSANPNDRESERVIIGRLQASF
jgi:phosphate-selective porin OprO/OprP